MNNTISVDSGSFQEQANIREERSRAMPVDKQSFFDKLSHIVSISQIVRTFGACAVIASMSLFMLQGWSEGNDIARYLKLLGQTGLLTAVGLVLSFVIKEYKGARVFFGLSLISVVANFTILGALTYSITQWDSHLTNYPSMMKWVVVDPSIFTAVFVGAVLLLALVTRFSFSIFARHISGTLTLSFLAMCALLLIPVRSSFIVCVVAGASIWGATLIINRLRTNDKLVLTREAKAAMATLFLPAIIIIARAISLYKIDTIMLAGLSGLAYFGLRVLITRFQTNSISTRFLEAVQYGVSLVLATTALALLPRALEPYLGVLFAMLVTGLLFDQVRTSKSIGWATWKMNFTAFVLVFGYLWLAVFDGSIEWQLTSLCTAGLMLALSWFTSTKIHNRQIINLSGVIGLIASSLMLSTRLIELVNLSNWMLIGLAGVLLIVGASLYERYGLSLSALNKRSQEKEVI